MLPHQIVELNEVDLLHPILFPFSAVCTVVKNKCSPLKLKLKLHRIHWKSCKNITVIKSFKGKETPKSKESSFFKDGVHIIQSTLLETNLFQEEAHVGLNNRLSLKTKTVQWNQKRHENVSIVSSNKVESLRDMEFDINSNSGDWPEEQCHWLTSWWLLYSCWHATEQSAPRYEGNTLVRLHEPGGGLFGSSNLKPHLVDLMPSCQMMSAPLLTWLAGTDCWLYFCWECTTYTAYCCMPLLRMYKVPIY